MATVDVAVRLDDLVEAERAVDHHLEVPGRDHREQGLEVGGPLRCGARSDAEQATTLVLARERSVAGVMEALRAGRTVATFNNMLCAHKWVLDLLMANMVGVRLNETEDGKVFLRLRNLGPKELTAEIEGIPVESVTLGAYQDILVGLRRRPEALTVTWKNLYTRPATNLTTTYLLTGATP